MTQKKIRPLKELDQLMIFLLREQEPLKGIFKSKFSEFLELLPLDNTSEIISKRKSITTILINHYHHANSSENRKVTERVEKEEIGGILVLPLNDYIQGIYNKMDNSEFIENLKQIKSKYSQNL